MSFSVTLYSVPKGIDNRTVEGLLLSLGLPVDRIERNAMGTFKIQFNTIEQASTAMQLNGQVVNRLKLKLVSSVSGSAPNSPVSPPSSQSSRFPYTPTPMWNSEDDTSLSTFSASHADPVSDPPYSPTYSPQQRDRVNSWDREQSLPDSWGIDDSSGAHFSPPGQYGFAITPHSLRPGKVPLDSFEPPNDSEDPPRESEEMDYDAEESLGSRIYQPTFSSNYDPPEEDWERESQLKWEQEVQEMVPVPRDILNYLLRFRDYHLGPLEKEYNVTFFFKDHGLELTGNRSRVESTRKALENLQVTLASLHIAFPSNRTLRRLVIEQLEEEVERLDGFREVLFDWPKGDDHVMIPCGPIEKVQEFDELVSKVTENFHEESLDLGEANDILTRLGSAEMKKIREKCSVEIEIPRGSNQVFLYGKKKNIERAKEFLKSLVSEKSNKQTSLTVQVGNPRGRWLFVANKEEWQGLFAPNLTITLRANGFGIEAPEREIRDAEDFLRQAYANFDASLTKEQIFLQTPVLEVIQADKGFFDRFPKITHNLNGGPADFADVSGTILLGPGKKIELIQGNIVHEKVDAIVNAANSGLDHASGVAGAIRAAGGPAIVNESQRHICNHGDVTVGTVTTTSGGNLSASHVIHAVGPRWNVDNPAEDLLKKVVRATLQAANNLKAKKIALPALSCGIFQFPVKYAASIILKALIDNLSGCSVDTVRIVILDDPTFKDFKAVFDEVSDRIGNSRELSDLVTKYGKLTPSKPSESSRSVTNKGPAKWSYDDNGTYRDYSNDQNPRIEQAFQNQSPSYQFVGPNSQKYSIHFSTMTQTNVKTKVTRAVKRTQPQEDSSFASPFASFASALSSSVSSFFVGPQVSGLGMEEGPPKIQNEVATTSFFIYGRKQDVTDAARQIRHKLASYWDSDDLDLKSLSWDQRLTPSQRYTFEEIASSFGAEPTWTDGKLTLKGLTASVAKAKARMYEELLKVQKDAEMVTYPPEWEPQHQTVQLFEVKKDSPEWTKVRDAFAKTLDAAKITKVERVQNKFLWRNFMHERETVKIRNNNPEINEKLLFHGTRGNDSANIYDCDEGFDMRYSNQGLWGRGNYFAVNASYSNSYKSTLPNGQGHQFFLASVITGDTHFCSPDGSLTKPPPKKSALNLKNQLYDSVSGNTGGSVVFILYDNRKAYPSYLITFRG